jgi:hypothetical protein
MKATDGDLRKTRDKLIEHIKFLKAIDQPNAMVKQAIENAERELAFFDNAESGDDTTIDDILR